jgi:hypothetical protein
MRRSHADGRSFSHLVNDGCWHRQENPQFLVFLSRLSDAFDNAPQVVLETLVVIQLEAEANGFAVARDGSKRVIDIVSCKSNPHVANRGR